VENSCKFGIEPSGSIKCWETIECRALYLAALVDIAAVMDDTEAKTSRITATISTNAARYRRRSL
jgi:hypothetical protein